MVEFVAFLPDTQSLSIMNRLCEPIVISRLEKSIGGQSMLLLGPPGAPSAALRSKDHTVVFKFEVFELVLEPWARTTDRAIIELKRFSGWDAVKCLFRFEWLRATGPGELPSGSGGIIGERGRRESIPPTASSVAVTMVGIALWNTRGEGNPIAVIATSDDDPVTLRISESPEEIEAVLLDCELIGISGVQQWAAELSEVRNKP